MNKALNIFRLPSSIKYSGDYCIGNVFDRFDSMSYYNAKISYLFYE